MDDVDGAEGRGGGEWIEVISVTPRNLSSTGRDFTTVLSGGRDGGLMSSETSTSISSAFRLPFLSTTSVA
jgi:hypothetical protein